MSLKNSFVQLMLVPSILFFILLLICVLDSSKQHRCYLHIISVGHRKEQRNSRNHAIHIKKRRPVNESKHVTLQNFIPSNEMRGPFCSSRFGCHLLKIFSVEFLYYVHKYLNLNLIWKSFGDTNRNIQVANIFTTWSTFTMLHIDVNIFEIYTVQRVHLSETPSLNKAGNPFTCNHSLVCYYLLWVLAFLTRTNKQKNSGKHIPKEIFFQQF